MASRGKTASADVDRDRDFDLVRRFPLRHIRDEAEADEADEVILSLISRPLEPDEQDYLDVLTDLVERSESIVMPRRNVPDHETIRTFIEVNGFTQGEIAAMIDASDSMVSEALNDKRRFTRKQIGIICKRFKLRPGAFTFEG